MSNARAQNKVCVRGCVCRRSIDSNGDDDEVAVGEGARGGGGGRYRVQGRDGLERDETGRNGAGRWVQHARVLEINK